MEIGLVHLTLSTCILKYNQLTLYYSAMCVKADYIKETVVGPY